MFLTLFIVELQAPPGFAYLPQPSCLDKRHKGKEKGGCERGFGGFIQSIASPAQGRACSGMSLAFR
jgi:hypothetical protein